MGGAGKKCFYCNQPLLYDECQIDHIIPESIGKSPESLTECIIHFNLPNDWKLQAIENLAPSCAICNNKKGVMISNSAAFLLSQAAAKSSMVLQLLTRFQQEVSRERIVLDIVAAIQRGDFDPAELSQRLAQIGQPGSVEFSYPLTLEGREPVLILRRGDLEEYLDLPVKHGSAESEPIQFVKDDGSIRFVRTCREYRSVIAGGFFAPTTYAMKMEAYFRLADGILGALEKAAPASMSYIRSPRIGVCDLHWLPAKFVPSMKDLTPEEDPEIFTSRTLEDLRATGHIDVLSSASNLLTFEYQGMTRKVVEVLRADLNGDGMEDILVFLYDWATGGTFGGGNIAILTKSGPEALLGHAGSCSK